MYEFFFIIAIIAFGVFKLWLVSTKKDFNEMISPLNFEDTKEKLEPNEIQNSSINTEKKVNQIPRKFNIPTMSDKSVEKMIKNAVDKNKR